MTVSSAGKPIIRLEGTHVIVCELPPGFFVRRAEGGGGPEALYEAIQRARVDLSELEPHVKFVKELDALPRTIEDIEDVGPGDLTPFMCVAGTEETYVSLYSHFEFRFVIG